MVLRRIVVCLVLVITSCSVLFAAWHRWDGFARHILGAVRKLQGAGAAGAGKHGHNRGHTASGHKDKAEGIRTTTTKLLIPIEDWKVTRQELISDLSAAQELVTPEDDKIIQRFGGISIDELLKLIKAKKEHELRNFMSTDKYYNDVLNVKGLQVLRVMIANRIQDWLRSSRKQPPSPLYSLFRRDGIVSVDLSVFGSNSRKALLNITAFLRDITGFRYLSCQDHPGGVVNGFQGEHGKDPEEDEKMTWMRFVTKSGLDDPQIRMHVDNLMPRFKVFLFPKAVPIDHGPFHYVVGSHGISEKKMRWVFDITRRHRPESKDLRFNLSHWSYGSQTHGLRSYNFPSAIPFGTQSANTLVVADTGGFHFRGLQQPNSWRVMTRPLFNCSAAVMQKNLYRCISDRQAC